MGIRATTRTHMRPRRASPAGRGSARRHVHHVWCSAGMRRTVGAVMRPRTIWRPHKQKNMDPLSTCQRRETLSPTAKDATLWMLKEYHIFVHESSSVVTNGRPMCRQGVHKYAQL